MNRTNSQADELTPLLDVAATMPAPLERVLRRFEEALGHVAFPDVSLSTLEEAAESVRTRQAEVDELRSRIAGAEAELKSARNALARMAERGLAYARVFATGDEDLSQKLGKINVEEAPKRRRRKNVRTEESKQPDVAVVEDESHSPHLSMVG